MLRTIGKQNDPGRSGQGCEVCKFVTFVEDGGRDGRSIAWLIDFATDA